MTGDDRLHPHLGDALDGGEPDADALDAIARRLAATAPEAIVPPPPDLFERIAAEVTSPRPAEAHPVVPLDARRRTRWVAVAGAAAAIVLVVAAVALTRDDDPAPTREEIVLAALPGFEGARGAATLEVQGDDRSVAVEIADVDVPAGSHLELWLLDADVAQIVPLGEITGEGPHSVPLEVDLDRTPVVDVSLEPDDGDPAHSGVSVVRGELPT